MIIRAAQRPRYVVVRQESMRDFTLSFKARGLLAYILSFPDHWKIDYRSLLALGVKEAAKVGAKPKDGADSIKAGLRELREAGYLEMRKKQNDAGQFGEWESIVYESPLENPYFMERQKRGEPAPDIDAAPDNINNPMSGKPAQREINNNSDERENRPAENPMSGKPAHIRNTESEEILSEGNTVEGENTFSPAAAPLAPDVEGEQADTPKRRRGRPSKAEKSDSTQSEGKSPEPTTRKAASEPQGPPAGALGEFYAAFVAARNKPPIFANVATAARQASKLREREGAEGFAACLKYFFTGDDWYRQKGFAFSIFVSQFETISAAVEQDRENNKNGYQPHGINRQSVAGDVPTEERGDPGRACPEDPAASRASARLARVRGEVGTSASA